MLGGTLDMKQQEQDHTPIFYFRMMLNGDVIYWPDIGNYYLGNCWLLRLDNINTKRLVYPVHLNKVNAEGHCLN